MPTAEQLRDHLMKKLKELFQLDQPDLDFGFYRIMHAKSKQVSEFIEKDLLKIVENAFGTADESRKAKLQAEYDDALRKAEEYGAPNPDEAPVARKAKAALDALKDSTSAEADIYDHLYRFFERYYDDGDFISRRYYSRETTDRAAPFAIPYNGEDVKLHWANADQYYVKTSEYFNNFTFDLRQAKEAILPKLSLDFGKDVNPLKAHFRIVEATEGEHGNVKAADTNKRFFIIHGENPVVISEGGELIINFEYRPDPEKTGQDGTWRNRRNAEAVETVLSELEELVKDNKSLEEYLRLFKVPAPTDSDKKRPLLAKYISQYTARNTMDYFIHKDLGGFLRRELDFYIKNEIMRLDDIEDAEIPAVETYLSRIKVLRKIATKLIDFLAQLEDFQKKLWLKKKFVVETNYCMTLDRVPEELYPEIASNQAQQDEWVKLFSINEIIEIQGNLLESALPGYSNPLTTEFLKAYDKLMLDTRFFSEDFNARLLGSIDDLDSKCDGLLINSENLQAAIFLGCRYHKLVDGVYLDPPYNTDASEIIYKNGFKKSSWASLMFDRLIYSKLLQKNESCICVTIDDFQKHILKNQLDIIYGEDNHLATAAIRSNPQGRSTVQGFSINHEYGLFYRVTNLGQSVGRLTRSEKQIGRYNKIDERGQRYLWENFRKTGTDSARLDRPKQFYPIVVGEVSLRVPKMSWDDSSNGWVIEEDIDEKIEKIVFPIDEDRNERVWKWGHDRVRQFPNHLKVEVEKNGNVQIYRRNYLNTRGSLPGTWWDKGKYGAGSHGSNLLTAMFGKAHVFSFPKSVYAVEDCIRVITNNNDKALILDLFAGSGTTAQATINLNRSDQGFRKYILCEMGGHFDEILKPRLEKAVFSAIWNSGKPRTYEDYLIFLEKKIEEAKRELAELLGIQDEMSYEFQRQFIEGEMKLLEHQLQNVECLGENYQKMFPGISHCFKYLRLESYEDTLNNLVFDENLIREKAITTNPSLKEDYMLHYFLNVETNSSQSLLNTDDFADPLASKLKLKKPGSDEYTDQNVDLIETFNYLIGLRVIHIGLPQIFSAKFTRNTDPELPEDQHTKLLIDGKIKQDEDGPWWFRKVEGWVPKDSSNPNNGQREKILVVWRKLIGDIEQDNLMLDEWFQKNRISTRDFEFDTIYVNGSNNLPNLQLEGDTWKVRLIEEEFHKRMWDVEGA